VPTSPRPSRGDPNGGSKQWGRRRRPRSLVLISERLHQMPTLDHVAALAPQSLQALQDSGHLHIHNLSSRLHSQNEACISLTPQRRGHSLCTELYVRSPHKTCLSLVGCILTSSRENYGCRYYESGREIVAGIYAIPG
jgi:hypothetical protein